MHGIFSRWQICVADTCRNDKKITQELTKTEQCANKAEKVTEKMLFIDLLLVQPISVDLKHANLI